MQINEKEARVIDNLPRNEEVNCMMCPKCEEGKIVKIQLKMSGDEASLCNYCETIWLKDEEIRFNTGHPYDATRKDDREYTLEVSEDSDQEHRPAKYTKNR